MSRCPATRDMMGIPDHLEPATKPQLGAQMLAEALDAGIEVPWAAADEVYGQDPELRKLCEERSVGYVFGVACSFLVTLPSGARIRADKALTKVPGRAWTITSCGAGSKGERRYAYAWIAAKDRRRHLLIRRNLHDPARVDYFWCFVPDGRPVCLPILAAVCGRRWTAGEDHECSKDQFGYDHAQVRLYTPIMRHLTLVMAALAICAVTAADLRKTSPAHTDPGRPAATRRPRPHPVHRSRGQTALHAVQPDPAQHRPRTALVPMATPAPGPRPLVPPPRPAYAALRPSHDQVTKYGCRNRRPTSDSADVSASMSLHHCITASSDVVFRR